MTLHTCRVLVMMHSTPRIAHSHYWFYRRTCTWHVNSIMLMAENARHRRTPDGLRLQELSVFSLDRWRKQYNNRVYRVEKPCVEHCKYQENVKFYDNINKLKIRPYKMSSTIQDSGNNSIWTAVSSSDICDNHSFPSLAIHTNTYSVVQGDIVLAYGTMLLYAFNKAINSVCCCAIFAP